MKLIDVSLKRPVSVIVGVLLALIFGAIAISKVPIQLKPTIDKPIITITTTYTGAAPQEIEEQITIPIEEQVKSVENLRKMTSSSVEGSSRISLEFDWGIDKDLASIDILKKVNLVGDLPEEAETPIISAISSDEEQPVFWMTAKSQMDVNRLREYVEDIIKPQIERAPGVGRVRIFGGQDREIRVILDLNALNARKLTIEDIRTAIANQNRNVRGGYLDQGKLRFTVRTLGLFKSLADIENVIVKKNTDGVIYLKDVARVIDTFKDSESIVTSEDEPTVALGIIKKSGTNTIQVVKGVWKAVESLKQEIAYKGVTLKGAYDESEYIWDSVYFALDNLKYGAVLAVLVLIFFLRSIRSTIIIAFAIPISLIATFIVLYAGDRSLNIISLAGLAFASGMVVDNAVVVLENIFRHLEMGKERVKASFDATTEVWGAILASTLTTLAVFIPIIFIEEEAGQLFKDIAITISSAVALSLIVSLTVIPMLGSRWLKAHPKTLFSHEMEDNTARFHNLLDIILFGWLGRAIHKAFLWSVNFSMGSKTRKIAVVAVIFVIFWFSLKLTPKMEYLPTGNRNFVIVIMKSHVGTNITKREYLADKIRERIKNLPEVKHYFSVVSRDFNMIGLVCKKEYSLQVAQIAGKVTGMIQDIPGFEYLFATQVNLFGRRLGKGVDVDIKGLDLSKIQEYAANIQQKVQQLPGVLLVRSSLELGQPELQVKLDHQRAADLGISTAEIAMVVETLIAGKSASLYKIGGEEYDITLRGDTLQLIDEQSLENVILYTSQDKPVKLSSLVYIEKTTGPTKIDHIEMDRSITLAVNIGEKVPLQEIIEQIENNVLKDLRKDLPYGYSLDISGSASDLALTAQALKYSFLLAIVIIYLLMASLFESFVYPFIIMFSVPLATTGAILGVYLKGVSLDVVTFLGFIILCGIVVNNAILIVHQALNHIRLEGMDPDKAILESCHSRMRPIFMTTVTTILGMLPLTLRGGAGSELYSGLGTAVVGGLALSTVFTLILVPVTFSLFIDVKTLFGGKKEAI